MGVASGVTRIAHAQARVVARGVFSTPKNHCGASIYVDAFNATLRTAAGA
jgi:hypothetical protein